MAGGGSIELKAKEAIDFTVAASSVLLVGSRMSISVPEDGGIDLTGSEVEYGRWNEVEGVD
jgi:hypothetical protein